MSKLGVVRHIATYPVKSMRGEERSSVSIGVNGIPGDRMYAFVKAGSSSYFPWLTARDWPGLLHHQPVTQEVDGRPRLFVRLVSGDVLPVTSDEMLSLVEREAAQPVRLHVDHRGNHDSAYLSLITTATLKALAEAGGVEPDHRRFRMNLVIESAGPPFVEREWVGRTLSIGDARLVITDQDKRCVMITMNPESAVSSPEVLKAAADLNDACAGVYASVAVAGTISVGDEVSVAASQRR
ncbi:MAG TPA: MOSC domain-containing protein [Chloroflexota bacterium]|nr:MOSC domain-containing protein [Chloroflexota bacterium]